MNTTVRKPRTLALFVTATLAAASIALPAADVLAQRAPAAPPVPSAPAAPAAVPDSSDLDAQLDAARRRLEQAASEVARLSTQLSSTAMQRVVPLFEPGHAIIGVQVEPAATGARVREVSPGGPAAEAGMRTGDVIVSLNGTTISNNEPAREVTRIMRAVKPDTRVSVRVLRDGKPQEFTVTARGGPAFDFNFADLPDFDGALMVRRPLGDMELATLSPQLGSYFGTDKGVLVVRAPADGALKLEDGDVILSIDGREPSSGSHATRILGSYQPGEKVTLRIVRRHKTEQIEATLPERSHMHHEALRRAGPLPAPQRRLVIFGSGVA